MSLDDKLNTAISFLIEGNTDLSLQELERLLTSMKKTNPDPSIIGKLEGKYIQIANRFHTNQKEETYATKTGEEIKVEKNAIVVAILSLLEELRKVTESKLSIKEKEKREGVFLKRRADEMMGEVCTYIEKAKSIRVIGANRQEKYEKEPVACISEYYATIEKRCAHDFEGLHPLTYRRITNRDLSRSTINHVEKCFVGAEKNKNTLKVLFYGKLHLTYTYLLIDTIDGDSILILNLYTKDNDIEILDTSFAYCCFDEPTIKEFKVHFQNAWDTESELSLVLKDRKEFSYYIPFDPEVENKMTKIRKHAFHIPKESIRLEHLKYHLREFSKRLGQLGESLIPVPHTDKNQRISTAYKWYIKTLARGCSYKTISVFEFWDGIQNLDIFLAIHRDRFESKEESGNVTRIYIVDNTRLIDSNYIQTQKEIIRKNFELAKEFSNNYDFLILFVDDYERFLNINRNCAIWSKDNEFRVVFLSKYPRDFSERGVTNIHFIEEWNNFNPINLKRKERYTRASNQIARSTKMALKQNSMLKEVWQHRENLTGIKKLKKDVVEKALEQIKFLSLCNVDIDRYLY